MFRGIRDLDQPHPPPTVLLIDPDPKRLLPIAAALSADFTTLTASTRESAVALMLGKAVDVVVADSSVVWGCSKSWRRVSTRRPGCCSSARRGWTTWCGARRGPPLCSLLGERRKRRSQREAQGVDRAAPTRAQKPGGAGGAADPSRKPDLLAAVGGLRQRWDRLPPGFQRRGGAAAPRLAAAPCLRLARHRRAALWGAREGAQPARPSRGGRPRRHRLPGGGGAARRALRRGAPR